MNWHDYTELRRDIHRNPELGFEEFRTAALVAERLEKLGYEVVREIAGTGVVGTLRKGKSSRSIGLRADMDALPIVEATGVEWASATEGIMHACGHDGHTAIPQRAIDPTIVAASTIMALQTITSRNLDPLDSAVISVGMLQAGATYNVIPDSARLEPSVRAFSAEVRDELETRIRCIGARADVICERGYPMLINTTAETDSAITVAREVFGEARVITDIAPLMGSEDFAYMLQERPDCYLLIGNGHIGQENEATGLTHCMVQPGL